jgi:hypothetical protein
VPFHIRQRVDLADYARHFALKAERPWLALEGLVPGVDNVRHDVRLSPKLITTARAHISHLICTYGAVKDLAAEIGEFGRAVRPASSASPGSELKPILVELSNIALTRAKASNNISIDLLYRVAVIKFMRCAMAAEFATVVERCRTRLKTAESAKHATPHKLIEMRERVSNFKLAKKTILRRIGQELLEILRQVERETAAPARRSLFGGAHESAYELLLNPLLFTDDGNDDFIHAEQYVMLGNYDRDPDRFEPMCELTTGFLESLGFGEGDDLDHLLNVPENAQELMAGGDPNESSPRYKEQRTVLAAWLGLLETEGVFEHIVASYEVVPLLAEYTPLLNPQQLKNALISRSERKTLERLIEEHGRLSVDNFHAAVRRMNLSSTARLRVAGQFFSDFVRFHRDIRRLECLNGALDAVSIVSDRLRELSAINNTLYEFLLSEERKPEEEKVCHHVIMKADIRESTLLTRTLFQRGLNPASYFSLNFYEPVSKLLPKYAAQKVFIEGDAVILALFEREGESGLGVARACALAREIIAIVSAYNEVSRKSDLPTLELGIGITYQDAPPMYLVDDGQQIMISPALNESDRLSSCSKSARKMFAGVESLFNVFCFQTIADADTAGQPEEFLMRFNIGGINLNEAAFQKLQQEIALQAHEVALPNLWDDEPIRLYSGAVSLGSGMTHKLIIREARIPHVDARDFHLIEWTGRRFYEVVTNDAIYQYLDSGDLKRAAARA